MYSVRLLCPTFPDSTPKIERSFMEEIASLPSFDAKTVESKFELRAQCTQNSRRRKNGWKKWRDTGLDIN